MVDELLLGTLVAEHTLLTGHDRTELNHRRGMWVVAGQAISQSVTMFQFVAVQTVLGFGMFLVTGIAPFSDQRLFVIVSCRAQLVAERIITGILCRVSATKCHELGVLRYMTVAAAGTSIRRMCGVTGHTITSHLCIRVLVVPVAHRAFRVHRRDRHGMTA